MKKKLVICMLVLLGLCWYSAVGSMMGASGNYQDAIEEAKELEAKEIYIKAIDSYEEALNYQSDDLTAMYGIATDYKLLGEEEEYEKQMHAILSAVGPNEDMIKELYKHYVDGEQMDEAAEFIYGLKDQYPENELIDSLYDERKGDYIEIYQTYEEISSYNGNYAIYTRDGKKGLLNAEGKSLIAPIYTEITYPSGENNEIAVSDGEKAFHINTDGYKVAETSEKYEYLSALASGCILAKKDGKYGYLDENYAELTPFEWEDATMVYYRLGAVKKNGKWAFINQDMELLTEYIYDDVIYNEWHVCSEGAVAWAGINGAYQLVNAEGKVVTTDTYEDAKVFAGEDPCAVKKDGRWGFVSVEGEEVIAPTYEDAESFHMGFAPVKKKSQWGLVDAEGNIVLDYSFDEIKSLNDNGVAPVKIGDIWSLIKMKIYN